MSKSFEQSPNSGALFKNEEKKPDRMMKAPDGSEYTLRDADYKGSALVNGIEMWIDATLKRSKAGRTYMYLKFNPKQQQQQQRAKPVAKGLTEDNWDKVDFNDDASIPF